MKKSYYSLALALLLCSSSFTLYAQDDISSIFKSGMADLNRVAEGYLKPAGNGFSAGLGSNWYNTAEVHKKFGFDLTFGVGAVQAPAEDRMFSITGLTNLRPTVAGTTEAPSFAGSGNGIGLELMQPKYLTDGTTQNPLWDNGNGKITSFTTPGGVSRYVPAASIQLTLGLPFINDVSLRLVPAVTVKGFKTSEWGIGIKHNFKQWIPVVSALPFDASFLLAYTKFDMKYTFPASAQITPDKLVSGGLDYIADPSSSDYSDQAMNISANAVTANVIVSKNFLFITPYLGFGFTRSNFDLTMAGNYPTLGDPVKEGNTYKMQINNMPDPVKISQSELMPGATIGLRAKILMVLSVHAQYTLQKYPTAMVGLGFSFR